MDPLEICTLLLRSLSLLVLAYGAYLCIAHRDVLDGFHETMRSAGARAGAAARAALPIRGKAAGQLAGKIAAAAICIILVALVAACGAETAAQRPATLPASSIAVQWTPVLPAMDGRHGDGDFEAYEYH